MKSQQRYLISSAAWKDPPTRAIGGRRKPR